MAALPDDFAPYTSVAGMLKVVSKIRSGGLPDPLTPLAATRIGVPESNATRVLQALRFLGLIEEDGYHTPELKRLKGATTDEYPEIFEAILRKAYASVFEILDPATADAKALEDAFRHFEPNAQRMRMIGLFLALAQEAGLPVTAPRRQVISPQKPVSRPRSAPVPSSTPTSEVFVAQPAATPQPVRDRAPHPALWALFDQLPDKAWSKERRDLWVTAVETVLDWEIAIQPTTQIEAAPAIVEYIGGDASRRETTREYEEAVS